MGYEFIETKGLVCPKCDIAFIKDDAQEWVMCPLCGHKFRSERKVFDYAIKGGYQRSDGKWKR